MMGEGSRVGNSGKSGGGNSNILDMDDIAAHKRRLVGKESSEMFRSTADLRMKSGLGSLLSRRDARFDKNPNVDSMLNEASGVNTTTRAGECDDSNLVGNQFTRSCDLTSRNTNVTNSSNNDSMHVATLFNNEQVAFTSNGTHNLNKSTAFSNEVTDGIFSVSNYVSTEVTGSEIRSTPCMSTMSTGGVVNANEATGMGRFNSKSSNTSHTSIATGFFTFNDGVSKGSSGFASPANGGATPGNDTPFASKPANINIRESSRSLLEEVSDGKYDALFNGLSDMHGDGQNYDGVDMELTKSILEEISE
ncbi:hypothetical protein Tco_1473596 [Tanacetum coccineum]